eukprot:03094_3
MISSLLTPPPEPPRGCMAIIPTQRSFVAFVMLISAFGFRPKISGLVTRGRLSTICLQPSSDGSEGNVSKSLPSKWNFNTSNKKSPMYSPMVVSTRRSKSQVTRPPYMASPIRYFKLPQ